MKVLVTGGSSLLGRYCAKALAKRGHQVTTFQRSPSGQSDREVLGDVRNLTDLESAVADMDAVIHLAAKVSPVGDWEEFEAVNVGGTLNLIEAMGRAGVTRLVHVSTPSVAHSGGALMGAGASDADPSKTSGHYSTSKAIAELAALEASGPDLSVVVLRPHLVWGPGDTQLVGRIVDRAKAGRLALIGSGLALIDSTYIDNAADALVHSVERADQLAGQKFVITNGEPRTVTELISRIVLAAGLGTPTRKIPSKVAIGAGSIFERAWQAGSLGGEPPITSFGAEQLSTAHWFSQKEVREALDWEPQISLDEGFKRLTLWFGS